MTAPAHFGEVHLHLLGVSTIAAIWSHIHSLPAANFPQMGQFYFGDLGQFCIGGNVYSLLLAGFIA